MSEHPSQSGGIIVVLETPGCEQLQELLALLQRSDVPVRTKTITDSSLSEEVIEIDLRILTEKQLDTLQLALREGYYERPRETDLGALAEQLSISESAVSQRLRNAETKLIQTALEPFV